MPPPVVWVIAILGTVAAGVAFKEFVYDPHIQPWLEDARERRRERRARNRNHRTPVMETFVATSTGTDDTRSQQTEEMKEIRSKGRLRHRKPTPKTFQDEDTLPLVRLSPSLSTSKVELLLDTSNTEAAPPTPSPPPQQKEERSLPSTFSSPHIPSLSQSHPLQLDAEADVELLSGPSSPSSFVSSINVRSASPRSPSGGNGGGGERNDVHPFSVSTMSSSSTSSSFEGDASVYHSFMAPDPDMLIRPLSPVATSPSPNNLSTGTGTLIDEEERSDIDLLSDLDVASEMSWEDAASPGRGSPGSRA